MKKRPVATPKKRNQTKVFASTELFPATYELNKDIYGSVCEKFPDAWPRKLREWREVTEKKSLEPELYLFIALMCGSQFRTVSPEGQLQDVRDYLYNWLAWGDDLHRMRSDVAELVVSALTPGISKEIEKRGHQRGLTHGEYTRKKGRIPEYRGAWVAALIIANHLIQKGMRPVRAKAQAVKLIIVLLEKNEKTALREFNRYYRDAPKDVISNLRKELVEEYKFWMKQDGIHEGDFEPPKKQAKAHAAWKSKHKALPYFFKQQGREQFCGMVLSRIEPDLWKPLWDMKAGNIDKKVGSE